MSGDNIIPLDQARAWVARLKEAGILSNGGEKPGSRIADLLEEKIAKAQAERLQASGPLTSNEITALRMMLVEFQAIKEGCPTARRLLDPN